MKILYAALKYDYGKPEQGYAFEHWNFFHPLHHMGHDILYFDIGTLHKKYGHEAMNQKLWQIAQDEKPDLLFAVLFEDQLDKTTITRITKETSTKTFAWNCDDQWRFDNYSGAWAPCFGHVATTAPRALPKYAAMGYDTVIKSQWACNPFLYKKLGLPLTHDASFVGLPHGDRRAVMERLQKAGITVDVYGKGWGHGRISQEDMIALFNQSRINLNLSNTSTAGILPGSTAPAPVPLPPLGMMKLVNALPGSSLIKAVGKKVWPLVAKILHPPQPAMPVVPVPVSEKQKEEPKFDQIKGRNFEIPACGGFQLSGQAEDLSAYFEPGKEIALFENEADLVDKIRYYLSHEDERRTIAEAGYKRVMAEHTWVHRFTEIFRIIGFDVPDANALLASPPVPGKVIEIE